MLEKLKALVNKIELGLHTVLDTVVAGVSKLNSVEKIAGAIVVALLAADVVTAGHFGMVSFLIGQLSTLKELVLDVAKVGISGVALVGIGYLIYKEARSK